MFVSLATVEVLDLNNFLSFCCLTRLREHFKVSSAVTEAPSAQPRLESTNFLDELDEKFEKASSETTAGDSQPRTPAEPLSETPETAEPNKKKLEAARELLDFVGKSVREVILDFFWSRFDSCFRKLKGEC